MMAILISCVFGLAAFSAIIAVCVRSSKEVAAPPAGEKVLEFSAAPVAVPAARLKVEGSGGFLAIVSSFEPKLPRLEFRADQAVALRVGAPAPQRFRPVSMQPAPSAGFIANPVRSIAPRPARVGQASRLVQ